MPFGLGTKHKEVKTSQKGKASKSSQADEAAAMLKKMEDKKAAGDCPFC